MPRPSLLILGSRPEAIAEARAKAVAEVAEQRRRRHLILGDAINGEPVRETPPDPGTAA